MALSLSLSCSAVRARTAQLPVESRLVILPRSIYIVVYIYIFTHTHTPRYILYLLASKSEKRATVKFSPPLPYIRTYSRARARMYCNFHPSCVCAVYIPAHGSMKLQCNNYCLWEKKKIQLSIELTGSSYNCGNRLPT